MKGVFIITVLAICIGCQQDSPSPQKTSYIGSVVEEYITFLDSADPEYNYLFNDQLEVLKKAVQNDNGYFAKLKEYISESKKFIRQSDYSDSCVKKIDIRKLDCAEVYQFSYKGSLTAGGYLITIYRKDSSYSYDYIRYQQGRMDVLKCEVGNHINRKLSQKEWDGFLETLEFADYWGLKSRNEINGLDGSSWTIKGMRERTNYSVQGNKKKTFHQVYRWSPYNTAFSAIGEYLINLGGEKSRYL